MTIITVVGVASAVVVGGVAAYYLWLLISALFKNPWE